VIQGVVDMREAYRDEQVAANYVDERFREPLGALLHHRQSAAMRRVVLGHRPEHVLELAPGPARLTVEVAPLLTRAPVILDASPQMLAQARARLTAIREEAIVVNGDAFDLPFDAQFDLVYTFRLIRHFEQAERMSLYRQIRKVLKPDGLLVFDAVNAVVSAGLQKDGDRHFDALLEQEELMRELRDAGFDRISLEGVQHRYRLLSAVQTLVAPRSRTLARAAMEVIDRLGGEPLEWIVTCRRA